MKFTRFLVALGFFTMLASSCSKHSCPAYSSDTMQEQNTETVLTIEEANV